MGLWQESIGVVLVFLSQIHFIFYHTVKYKTITKHFYLQIYKIWDYITYFGYKQKNLCSELLIQYKNMNVSYK